MRFALTICIAACLSGMACSRPTAAQRTAGPRIVSLAPSLTEVVAAVGAGDLMVGRTTACNYPPELVARVPAVGDFGRPSLESLMAVSPTVVIDVDLEDETVTHRLAELGVAHEHIPCGNVKEIVAAIRTVGRICKRDVQAAALIDDIEEEIKALTATVATQTNRPSVYLEIWHDPAMTVGGTAYLNDVITLAGGRNIAEGIKKGYFQISPEWILKEDPDIIICAYMAPARGVQAMLKGRPGWKQLTAVRTGAVFDGLNNDILLRPGPRVVEAVEAVRKCIALATEQ